VMVGGGGERKTLRLVAQYADACNLFATTPEGIAHKLDVLKRHCDDVGRDVSQIRVTMMHSGDELHAGDPAAFAESLRPYAALGVETVIVATPPTSGPEWVRSRVAPAVAMLQDI
jgi:alkanesulfonate monooxygenase SsuD/methylene tetrahydromethanopterin reductase-like flavin-dependent oxidoreductase (luciferase family)